MKISQAAREAANSIEPSMSAISNESEWRQDIAAKQRAIVRLESAVEEAVKCREEAEEFGSHLYYLIIGKSAEWSNAFGYDQATEDVDDAQRALREDIARLKSELGASTIEAARIAKDRDLARERCHSFSASVAELETQLKLHKKSGGDAGNALARVRTLQSSLYSSISERAALTSRIAELEAQLQDMRGILEHSARTQIDTIKERDSLAVRVAELEAILVEHAKGNVTFHLEAKGLAARLKLQERVAELEEGRYRQRESSWHWAQEYSKAQSLCDQLRTELAESKSHLSDVITLRDAFEAELGRKLATLRERVGPLVEEFRRTIQSLNLYGYDAGLLATALADFERTEGGEK